MIEFTALEFVLLLGNLVLVVLYYQLSTKTRQHEFAMAAILHGIHTNKLKIVETDRGLKVDLI
ncbi:hypothetical protein UFOVP133_8 [uncultured Caudovirales phage]|uniref:Uncharacterized protein n=1 Tax=uncultured Caudovirales phage TaxID=2100421 RepID=A0A6J5LBU3_9CAUD|nr:hypothetical protein UFOVP133_8 [uncultured Caudovirales phage]